MFEISVEFPEQSLKFDNKNDTAIFKKYDKQICLLYKIITTITNQTVFE